MAFFGLEIEEFLESDFLYWLIPLTLLFFGDFYEISEFFRLWAVVLGPASRCDKTLSYSVS